MKPLKKYIRETKGLCGPASLKILLAHYGKDVAEQELKNLSNANPETGTDHDGLMKAAKALGFKPTEKDNATLENLRQYVDNGVPVIVGWWSGEMDEAGDHYSVVYEVTDQTVSMVDPQLGTGITTFYKDDFDQRWYDFDGPENVKVNHWLMVVEPE